MISAGWNRGRVHAASATVEPRTPARSRPIEAAPSSTRAHGANARGTLRSAVPKAELTAVLLLIVLVGVAAAFVPGMLFEVGSKPAMIATGMFAALMAALAAILPLAGLGRRLRSREHRAVAHALVQERRRMAADVHDLIMQDLSLALANARTLVDVDGPAQASQAGTVVAAGERALAGARDVVSGLTERDSQPIVQAIEDCARTAARRTPLTFDAAGVPARAALDEPTRAALRHIAREAVANAVKHSQPDTVEVILRRADEWRLTVSDSGRGFDANRIGDGFGLASMHRHAYALGGTLHVRSSPGRGTTVEAVLP